MTTQDLRRKVRRGLAWSALSTGSMRFGSLLIGIVLARLLDVQDFGVYAVALMVQSILMNFAELGLAADLVRHGDIERRGPTITTIALISSGSLAALTWVLAAPFADLMGTPEAAPVIRVLGLTLPLAAMTAVPYAQLQRNFQQSRLFAVEGTNFVVGTSLTIALAVVGMGPMALAVGRVVGQTVATALQFRITRTRLRVGWRRDVAVSGLRFGFPLACAGLLAWTLLNVDTVLISTVAGATALGFYVLAFNISSWPSSVIGSAVKAVAFPAFAERGREVAGRDVADMLRSTALLWTLTVPLALGLAVLAHPVIQTVYGTKWLPAAAVLAALGVFGAFRVVFDLWVAFLTARGAAGWLVTTQMLWIVLLTPVMYVGIRLDGIRGAGWAHVIVAAGLMLPAYGLVLARHGVPAGRLLRGLLPGLLAGLPAGWSAWAVVHAVDGAFLQLALGGLTLVGVYGLAILPWARRQLHGARAAAATDAASDATPDLSLAHPQAVEALPTRAT